MVDLYLVLDIVSAFSLFWLVLYYLGRRYRLEDRGIEVKPLMLILRTKRVNKFLDWSARKLRKVISVYSDLSIPLAVGMMIYGAYSLSSNIASFFIHQTLTPVFPAIPFITIKLESLPYFIIALALIVILHEFAHGVVARHENITVKSAGVILLAVIPGGFVEPDEESFKKASGRKRLRVLAVGSSTNLISGVVVSLLLTAILTAAPLQPNGVLITGVTEGGPAAAAGLQPDDIIKAVDSVTTSNLEAIKNYMANVHPGTPITLSVQFATNKAVGTVTVTTISDPEKPERAIIGVLLTDNIEPPPFHRALAWFQFWSINLAIVNMLPIQPLDGGGLLLNIIESHLPKRSKYVIRATTSFFILLLMLNLTLTLVGPGFPKI
jgi:Zn-dependent protease